MTSRGDLALVIAATCLAGIAGSCTGAAPAPGTPSIVGKSGSFETSGWVASGNLSAAPICAPADALRIARAEGRPPARLGGDYWITPVDIGVDAPCRIDTAPTADADPDGELVSPEFTIDFPLLSFSIGAGGGGQAFELQVRAADGSFATVLQDGGPGTLPVQQRSWDLRGPGLPGSVARLHVIDHGGTAGPGLIVAGIRRRQESALPAGSREHAPVWGFADLHAHLFNHLGFGGRIFHGKVWAPGGMPEALAPCHDSHGTSPGGEGVDSITPDFGHNASGWPSFEGWPRYTTLVHQQAYVDWIRRAWEGGLRLIQVDVGNNKLMADVFRVVNEVFLTGDKTPLPYDDESVIRLQVEAARDFVTRGPGKDFAAIATSPEEARAIVASGKLALVLGIEVDALGGFVHRGDLGPDVRGAIREEIARLRDLGVRHVIPIHLVDNAFGAPAVYGKLFNTADFAENHEWFLLREAFDDGIRFNYALAPGNILTWFYEQSGLAAPHPNYPGYEAFANAIGLNPEGEILVQELMSQGLLVDIDHMSDRAAARTLELAEERAYPVMASHTGFRDLSFGVRISYGEGGSFRAEPLSEPYTQETAALYGTSDTADTPTERSKTWAQLQRIRALGGIVGVGIGAGLGPPSSWRARVPADCDGTSKSFAQSYLYAVEALGGRGIAIGTDINGLNGMPGPRFGTDACAGMRGNALREAGQRMRAQSSAQNNGVRYDTPIEDAHAWRFAASGTDGSAAYDGDERDVWEGIAEFEAGVDVDRFDPRPGFRWPWVQDLIRDYAWGFRLASSDEDAGNPGASRPTDNADRLAAYDAYYGRETRGGGRERLLRVWQRWQAAEGGSNPPLQRDHAGTRDFDINLDGLAHYGLLPDYLQDVRNDGLGPSDLAPLFHGVEDYIEMWERTEARAAATRAGASQRAAPRP